MSHYSTGGIEAIDYIKAKLTKGEFIGFCRGNVLKYVSRAGKKRGAKHCYQKAEYYLNLLADYERDQNLAELMKRTKKSEQPTPASKSYDLSETPPQTCEHSLVCLFCEKSSEENCDCDCSIMCSICGEIMTTV